MCVCVCVCVCLCVSVFLLLDIIRASLGMAGFQGTIQLRPYLFLLLLGESSLVLSDDLTIKIIDFIFILMLYFNLTIFFAGEDEEETHYFAFQFLKSWNFWMSWFLRIMP